MTLATRRWLNLLHQQPALQLPLFAQLDNLTVIWESCGHLPATWYRQAIAWAGLRQPQDWRDWSLQALTVIDQHNAFDNTTDNTSDNTSDNTKHDLADLLRHLSDNDGIATQEWQGCWHNGNRWQQLALLSDWSCHPERAAILDECLDDGAHLPPDLLSNYLTQHPDADAALRRVTPLLQQHEPSLRTALAVAHALIERQQLSAAKIFYRLWPPGTDSTITSAACTAPSSMLRKVRKPLLCSPANLSAQHCDNYGTTERC